jgi:manganese transport protein
MPQKNNSSFDKSVQKDARSVLSGKSRKKLFARLLPFIGPAFIASIAYVDPGNFATNISAGAQLGYTLLWVIILSNLIAMVIQSLSAKLGIATGKNLAEHCRESLPKWLVWGMWVLMELIAMATDLAEFLGAAVGLNLLLGIPLWLAGILTAIATYLILGLERFGFRPIEAVISSFVGVIAVSYIVEIIISKPAWGSVVTEGIIPRLQSPQAILLATGILGATVMPHAIFLHSALTQNRIIVRQPKYLKKLFRYELVDVGIAMGVASLVNGAMLIMAAATFHTGGMQNIGSLQEAYKTLTPLLGGAASLVFAISLLASGLSSASVGTMAGQIIMQGFIHKEIPIWVRRTLTMIPSLIVILIGFDPTRTLVISQVALSFGLPFAIIPLVIFTSQKERMGVLTNSRFTTVLASCITGLIIILNIYLIFALVTGK